jgi:hypothetical protein
MADDNTVAISFTASTDDALDGIAQIRGALAGLAAPISGLESAIDRMGDMFGAALPLSQIHDVAKAVSSIGAAAQFAASQTQNAGAQMRIMQIGLQEQKTLLDAEVNQFKITQDQKFALLQAETEKEYEAQKLLLSQKMLLGDLDERQQQAMHDRMLVLEAKHDADMLRLDEQSIAAQQALWTNYFSMVTGAFNTQLRGLLEGTTNWHQAMIKTLEDLTIKFIEMAEQMVVKWLAAEIAQTTATTSGAAARVAANDAASSAGILANIGHAVQVIMTDAAQAFAGVFAFLAPVMGPAAAGPAAAAQASVSAAAVFDVGTDYVVRGGLALIHPGETIIPAARGSGPYTGAPGGTQIHAPVSINVSALDSQSVARFFNDNSKHMLRAINDAVKRGAHLGLRAS